MFLIVIISEILCAVSRPPCTMFHVAMFSSFIFREITDVRESAPEIRLERPRQSPSGPREQFRREEELRRRGDGGTR